MQVCLVGCSKRKLTGEHKACELYQGEIFKKQLKLISLKHPHARVIILSAKYGALPLGTKIQDYDITLKNMSIKERKVWSYNVYMKLMELGIMPNDEIIFYCGKSYNEFLKLKFKNHKIPFKNLGLGKQLQALNEEIETLSRGNR